MLVGFWGRFDHIVRDRDILYARLQGILVVPFARAHSSSEFEAGENLLLKVCIFAGLTFCMAGWVSRLQSRGGRKVASLISILGVIAMGIAIEVGQVFLEPLVPDVTDFILYACGAIVGLAAFRILIPPQTIVLERRSLESA